MALGVKSIIFGSILAIFLGVGILMLFSVATGFNDWTGLGSALGPIGEMLGGALDGLAEIVIALFSGVADIIDSFLGN